MILAMFSSSGDTQSEERLKDDMRMAICQRH